MSNPGGRFSEHELIGGSRHGDTIKLPPGQSGIRLCRVTDIESGDHEIETYRLRHLVNEGNTYAFLVFEGIDDNEALIKVCDLKGWRAGK